MLTLICQECGISFPARQRSRKFCSCSCNITFQNRCPLQIRFWKHIDKGPHPLGCWLWVGARSSDGYGSIRVDGKNIGAHRVSYELHYGLVLPGFEVCHTCDTPACVNPKHLFLDTHRGNIEDAARKGKFSSDNPEWWQHRILVHNRLGNSQWWRKLTDEQVVEIRSLTSILSNKKIAEMFNVHRSTIWKIRHGKRRN